MKGNLKTSLYTTWSADKNIRWNAVLVMLFLHMRGYAILNLTYIVSGSQIAMTSLVGSPKTSV